MDLLSGGIDPQSMFVSAAQQSQQMEQLANTALSQGMDLYQNKKYAQAAEAFRRGYVEVGEVGARLAEALGVENVGDAWIEVGRLAGESALDVETVSSAVLGNRDALDLVQLALLRGRTVGTGVEGA